MMATNLRGAVEVTKYAIPYLSKSLGNIVNISNSLGLISSYANIAYSMTKAALNHFTKCLAIDLAQRLIGEIQKRTYFVILSVFVICHN